jgi:putative heme transporter
MGSDVTTSDVAGEYGSDPGGHGRSSGPASGPSRTVADRSAVPRFLDIGASWAWRFIVVLAAGAALVWLVARLRLVVIPLLVSAILAALLVPVVDLLDRRLPRLVAVWATFLGLIGALVGIGFLLRSTVTGAVEDLRDQWRSAIDDVEDWLVDGPLGLDRSRVETAVSDIGDAVNRYASGWFDEPADVARTATDVVTGILLSIVLTFFLLKDGRSMWAWLLERLHPARRATVDAAGAGAFQAIQGWIRGIAITGFVDGFLIGAALVILGVPGAVPLAVITFFAAFIPIVGATLAGALATAVALTTEGPGTAVVVAIVVLVVQQVEGDVLLPVVMYRQVALHPVVVLLALAVGAAVAGLVGAVVAVPVTACLVAAVAAARKTGTAERLQLDDVET